MPLQAQEEKQDFLLKLAREKPLGRERERVQVYKGDNKERGNKAFIIEAYTCMYIIIVKLSLENDKRKTSGSN